MVRGLRKYLTPFAPDQSGAVSILYELGGMVVILDAGGCTGNICGFDEPRWSSKRSAVFSAGLRDMDAIMGRDKALVEKIAAAQEKLRSKFIAIVGTPVPAVIGTDYQALRRMLQKKVSVPILCIETNGMKSFEYGAEKAYPALLAAFASPTEEEDNAGGAKKRAAAGRIGVFGTFPMTESDPSEQTWIRESIAEGLEEGELFFATSDVSAASGTDCAEKKHRLCFYGHGASLADYRSASENALNLVTSVPGLAAAKELQKQFGTEYRVMHPAAGMLLQQAWEKLSETEKEKLRQKREVNAARTEGTALDAEKPLQILIVQEQVLGNSLREELRKSNGPSESLACGNCRSGLSGSFAHGRPERCSPLDALAASVSKDLRKQSLPLNGPSEIHVMSFFKMLPEWMEAGDRFLSEESELWAILNPEQSRTQNAEYSSLEQPGEAVLSDGLPLHMGYDLILGDPVLKKMLSSDFEGCFLEIPEPAISGFPVNMGGQDE